MWDAGYTFATRLGILWGFHWLRSAGHTSRMGWAFQMRHGVGWVEIHRQTFWYPWMTRWWFQTCFIFTPIWGRFQFWLIFFQMGWNHQPDDDVILQVIDSVSCSLGACIWTFVETCKMRWTLAGAAFGGSTGCVGEGVPRIFDMKCRAGW